MVTFFAIVVGELVPKRIGQIHAERIARFVARPIQWLSAMSKPFVWLLTQSTQLLLALLGIDERKRSAVTEEEIHAVLEEGSVAGVIEEEERRMVRNLFHLDDRSIATLMTPRAEIAYLDVDASPDEVMATLEQTPHSRYPVVRGGLKDVVGVVSARALLLALLRGQVLDLSGAAKPPVFVPESVSGRDTLETFRDSRTGMAFVVDEYGSLLGLVTLHATCSRPSPASSRTWARTRGPCGATTARGCSTASSP
jgi:putative hemolysin